MGIVGINYKQKLTMLHVFLLSKAATFLTEIKKGLNAPCLYSFAAILLGSFVS